MSAAPIRWGILGPGHISRSFAAALQEADGATLVAVGSRDLARAQSFAAEFGGGRAYGSYEELANAPDVDAVYVGTPHSLHEAHATLCLDAGRHVLCEKPLALNATQARRMAALARDRGLVLMEALWTRFLPAIRDLQRRIGDGALGEVRTIHADFAFRARFDPRGRLFAPELGGGALLDLGIYPLTLAFLVGGPPLEVQATSKIGATGVDEETSLLLRHRGDVSSRLYCGLTVDTACEAQIVGTRGRIVVPRPWWGARKFDLHGRDGQVERFEFERRGRGYTYEAEAFMDLVRSGRTESELMPLDESVAVLEVMDAIRARSGVRYPGE